ncbi:hypothetical protein FRC11_012935 [Ceratobasidium sp. 423]|nr:hypothetical protein FRC11_012935 [Ceratobasidium sp. 423]
MATAYLSLVAKCLAARSATRDEADDATATVLALLVFNNATHEQLQRFCDSWGQNFNSRIEAWERVGINSMQALNQAGPSRSSGGSGKPPQPRPDEEDFLCQQALAALATLEWCHDDNNQDAIQVILNAIGKDASAATPDKSLFSWASDAQDAPVNMHPDASMTIIAVKNYS